MESSVWPHSSTAQSCVDHRSPFNLADKYVPIIFVVLPPLCEAESISKSNYLINAILGGCTFTVPIWEVHSLPRLNTCNFWSWFLWPVSVLAHADARLVLLITAECRITTSLPFKSSYDLSLSKHQLNLSSLWVFFFFLVGTTSFRFIKIISYASTVN